jgi:hypothetical protein
VLLVHSLCCRSVRETDRKVQARQGWATRDDDTLCTPQWLGEPGELQMCTMFVHTAIVCL